MIDIVNRKNPFPVDWDNDEKFPNKEKVYETPEDDYKHETREGTWVDGKWVVDETQPPVYTTYMKMIHEIWSYTEKDSDKKHIIAVVKCPKCGSYNIVREEYNTISCLSGSAGTRYTCESCGLFVEEARVWS